MPDRSGVPKGSRCQARLGVVQASREETAGTEAARVQTECAYGDLSFPGATTKSERLAGLDQMRVLTKVGYAASRWMGYQGPELASIYLR